MQNLEVRFNKALVGMMMYNPDTMDIAKPSELLNSVKVIMSVLQSIENYGKESEGGQLKNDRGNVGGIEWVANRKKIK